MITLNTILPIFSQIINETSNLEIKESAFTSLATLAHNSPQIIGSNADTLNAIISKEAAINHSLKQLIDLGPFKITEDKGAPTRKQVLSLLQVMINKANDKVNYILIFEKVLEGLCILLIR